MTLEILSFDHLPGYAGPLEAARHPELADRFHFWRGASGRRYAATRFFLSRLPAYGNAVKLFIRRCGDEATVLGIATSDAKIAAPLGTDEVHLHLVQGGAEELRAAFEDLSPLVVRRPALYVVDRQAA